MQRACYTSPIGTIEVCADHEGILSIFFTQQNENAAETDNQNIRECITQLDEYFNGKRETFNLKLNTKGTPFQKRVWDELTKIPYGSKQTYKAIAEKVGNIKALRAVGSANNRNKFSIVVPCHRVIGSNNSLTGYAGGLWRKEWLLNHEQQKSN